MLIDEVKIYVCAGKGGKGCQSLYKDIFHRRGIPDGGDGGAGGNIVIESSPNLHTLLDFKYNQHYTAQDGAHGGSSKKTGRRGLDCLIKVPVGTIVKDAKTKLVIRDLAHEGERVIVAKGGAGGKGSAKLKLATIGSPGEAKELNLELKLVADVGIIGLPNAGKSTLISHISKVKSKIASYPFTTLNPILGVVCYKDETFVAADMPGLVEDAHRGRGLGDKFLRHIERTSVLVHVVDMAPDDASDPVQNYFRIENELELYDKKVHKKPRIVALNKMDMPGADENLTRFRLEIKKKVWPISALTGNGLPKLVQAIYRSVSNAREKHAKGDHQDRHQSFDR